MKKIFSCMIFLILLLSVFSCDLEESISGPRDTWCEKTIKVKDCDLTCYLLYSEEGYFHKDLNSDKFLNNKINSGLTVVLSPSSENIEWFKIPYIVKTFEIGENEVEGIEGEDSSAESKTFKVNSTLWNGIWLCNMKTFNENGPRTSPPVILRTDGEFNPFEGIEDLSWKEVVIAILEGI